MSKHTPTALRPVAAFALLGLLAACSPKQPEGETDASQPAVTTAAPTGQAPAGDTAPAADAAKADTTAMGVEELREAARKALSENRIYAPAGDNAVEYYLALRDKQPDDAATASALTDLMPYTVIATEQSITRKDFSEAERLSRLIARADPKAPSLPRLTHTIESGQKLAAQQQVDDAASKAKAQADAKAKEAQRIAAQAAEQKQAAEALAAQQARQEREANARAEAERTAAATQAEKPAPAPTPVPEAPKPAAAPPSAPKAPELRVVSAPAPRYPPDAFRAGTKGEVVVEITVAPDGAVSNARVVRATPSRVFDREALNAVRRWRFEPIGSTMTTRRTIVFQPG